MLISQMLFRPIKTQRESNVSPCPNGFAIYENDAETSFNAVANPR